ncbi:flavodoxin domain-containing protein [Sphingomonas sp. AOB5]|uniref:flavodoxin domain-containing protein n=1 Tax=Sphingomonas sp. AOB5 TaxID=3034017 RepID=UPI0023F9E18F|nr:flavodoxin domain-containing protein [Sphingomonas sp. AOB5]MDF7775604.1 flavodoxin domain-containing protein [Sphingomonas sp. AOB5]
MTILILVATMSGNAEMVADEIAGRIEDDGGTASILRMEKASVTTLAGATGPVLICSSTYGTGDVPDNGAALYAALQAERPDLAHLRYGVIALGDSVYPQTFCFGGRKFDELLASLGAQRVGDRLEHDARSGIYAEDAAGDWVETWLRDLEMMGENGR